MPFLDFLNHKLSIIFGKLAKAHIHIALHMMTISESFDVFTGEPLLLGELFDQAVAVSLEEGLAFGGE